MKKDPEAFNKYNEKNQEDFIIAKSNGCGNLFTFHCVRCGTRVTLEDSVSYQGENLICTPCAKHYEKNIRGGMFYWLAEHQTEAFD